MTDYDLTGQVAEPAELIRRTAVLSDDGAYRYRLGRQWQLNAAALPVCMLNPSTADHQKDDPTIRKLCGFARAWGYGGIVVVNLFALRTSSPRELKCHGSPRGSDNWQHIDQVLATARHLNTPVLAAWGRDGAHWNRQDEEFCRRAKLALVDLVCLGLTQDGFPKHPLARGKHHIPRDQRPISFRRWMEG